VEARVRRLRHQVVDAVAQLDRIRATFLGSGNSQVRRLPTACSKPQAQFASS